MFLLKIFIFKINADKFIASKAIFINLYLWGDILIKLLIKLLFNFCIYRTFLHVGRIYFTRKVFLVA